MKIDDLTRKDVEIIVYNMPLRPRHAAMLAVALLQGLEVQKRYDEIALILKIIKTAAYRCELKSSKQFTDMFLHLW